MSFQHKSFQYYLKDTDFWRYCRIIGQNMFLINLSIEMKNMKLIWEKKFKTYITAHRFSLQVKLLMLRDFITVLSG